MTDLTEDARRLVAAATQLASQSGHATVKEEHLLLAVAADRAGVAALSKAQLCIRHLTSALEARLARMLPSTGYRGVISAKHDLDAVLGRAARKRPFLRLLQPVGVPEIIAAVLDSRALEAERDASRFDPAKIDAFARRAVEEAERRRHGVVLAEHALLGASDSVDFAEPLLRAGFDVEALREALRATLDQPRVVSAKLASRDAMVGRACLRTNLAGGVVLSPEPLIVELLRSEHVDGSLAKAGIDAWTLLFAFVHGRLPDAGPEPSEERVRVVAYDDAYTTMEHVVTTLESSFDVPEVEADAKMREIHEGGSAVVGTFDREDALERVRRAREASCTEGMPLRIELEEA